VSNHLEVLENQVTNNLINFPAVAKIHPKSPTIATPKSDELIAQAAKLDKLSKYKCDFDYEAYRNIEKRYSDNPIRGGITMGTAFRLVNSHSTCQQCLYAFEIDTYGRGCVHNCSYCYAKAQLTVHGYWNNPIPVPVDLNEIRKAFYITFETEKPHKFRQILEKRIPLRIGSMSDSFMWMDQKIKITQELLKILDYYQYPYVVFTRSDLIATDEYMKLINPKLGSVQFSMASTNDKMNRLIEPGAPSAKRRLVALEKLNGAGIWTTVRINPLFPIYPDGYFTDPNFKWEGEVPKFDYSSFDMIDEIAAHKVPSVLAGFGRFSHMSLNAVEKATGFNLKQFYRRDIVNKSERDFHFSDREIRYYYEELKHRCNIKNIQFTTCYIGNGEKHFWKDQDLWSNKKDCCSIKGNVPSFLKDAREIAFESRLKFSNQKDAIPVSTDLHKSLGTIRLVEDLKLSEQIYER
jgi:DNA repair photolyase